MPTVPNVFTHSRLHEITHHLSRFRRLDYKYILHDEEDTRIT